MDNYETVSTCSYHSDSLQSNVSNLSGLSSYKNEFSELRNLVDPLKYPLPYSTFSSKIDDNITRQNKLQQIEFEDLERKVEIKFSDKIETLLSNKNKLENELGNANYFKDKLELEKDVYELTSNHSKLQQFNAKIQQEKIELDFENKNLKIELQELITEADIKNSSIQNLKQKVSEQYVDIENNLKTNKELTEKLNFLITKLKETEKLKSWYKEQLNKTQNEKIKLKDELNECKEIVSTLNINLIKYKNEVDKLQLKAHKEKQELYGKIEKMNLDYNVKGTNVNQVTSGHNVDLNLYRNAIEDLKEELFQIESSKLRKDQEFDKLIQENSNLMSNYLILQKILTHKEFDIELLETSKKELLEKLEHFRGHEKENVQLKNKISSLEIELNIRNCEKIGVEKSVQLIRDQVVKLKENYKKVKDELTVKNKKILQLENDKQTLFMNYNWTICELENIKQKHKDNEDLCLKLQKLNNDRIVDQQQIVSLEKEIKTLQETYNNEIKIKDKLIIELKIKLENDWQNYLKKTDDQKVQLGNNFNEKYIRTFFDNLNIEKFENSVDIRLKFMDKRIQETKNKLETIKGKLSKKSEQNKIKDLEVRLQVKDREMKEKQEKINRNNRTLLRKVKEHMKGRNSAEKQLKNLHNLNNALSDDNNKLKLLLNSKDIEIERLEKYSNLYKSENDKLKSELELTKSQINEDLLVKLQNVEKDNINFQNDLLENQSIIVTLKKDLKETTENLNNLSNEQKMGSFDIQKKVEYSQEWELKIIKLKQDHECLVKEYTNKINVLEKNIEDLKYDKFFLQRLSNDLKVTLNSYIKLNKALHQFDLTKTDKRPSKDLPMKILDNFTLNDEKYIKTLLDEHRSSVGKLMDKENQICFDKIRQEIFYLQDKIHTWKKVRDQLL